MEPRPQNGERFFGVRLHHFAHFADGGFAHLSFDARDVDHAVRRCEGTGARGLKRRRSRRCLGGGGQLACHILLRNHLLPAAGGIGRKHPRDQRPRDKEADQERSQRQDRDLDDFEPVRRVETQKRRCGRSRGAEIDLRKRHVDDLHRVAARFVVADRGFHQRFDLLHFLRGARLVIVLAAGHGRRNAIHGDRHRQFFHLAAVLRAGADGLRDLVVGRFLGARAVRLCVVAAIALACLLAARQRARDGHGSVVAAGGIGRILFHGLRRAHDLAVGIVDLRRFAGMVVVHVGRDLDADMTGSHEARHHGFDALAQAIFEGRRLRFFVRGGGFGTRLVLAAGEKVALVVDDGDARGLKPRDCGRYEMLDGRNLSAIERAARLEHDRGAGALGVVREKLALGHDEMDARGVDAVDRLDGAGQLAFERAQLIDVLDEGRRAERVRFVEDLVAHARGRKIFRCELHAELRHLIGRHQDRAAVALRFVGHVHRIELGGDRSGFARFEPGIKDALGRFADDARDVEKECGEDSRHAGHHAETRCTHIFDEIRQRVPPLDGRCLDESGFVRRQVARPSC